MNKQGNYEVGLLNIPSNVSENDTVKWLKSIDTVSCRILEAGEENIERAAILELPTLDMCEKLYQKSGKLFFQNKVEVMPYFPSSLKNWIQPLSCVYTRSNYMIPKYIQLFLDLNQWHSIVDHNGKYDVKIFQKMMVISPLKLTINDIPLSVTLAELNALLALHNARVDSIKKNNDENAHCGVITFTKKSSKEDFYLRKRFLEFDDGFATVEQIEELYFVPLDSPLITPK